MASVDYLSALNSKGSGLNITQIVDSLVEAEIAPQQNAINKKIEKKTTAISSLAEIVSELDLLKSDLLTLANSPKISPSSSNTALSISVSDNSKAAEFTSDVRVQSLATAQTLEFSGYSGGNIAIGTGTIEINFGTWSANESSFTANSSIASQTITINDSNNTLTGLASTLNALTGVSAKVVSIGDSGNNYSLVIQSDLGADRAIQINANVSTTPAGAVALSTFDTFDTPANNATPQVVAAADSALIVDGVTVYRNNNSVTDLFDGYTLNLNSTTTSSFRVSSVTDTTTALEAAKNLVKTMNATRSVFSGLLDRDETKQGALSDDPVAHAVSKKIRNFTTNGVTGFGSQDLYLSELGVQTNRDGSLSLNETTFKERLSKSSAVFDAIFNTGASSDSSYLTVERSNFANPTPGTYSFTYDGSTATLNGVAMSAGTDSKGSYFISSAAATAGIKVRMSQTVASANIFVGTSMVEKITDYIDDTIANSGDLSKRKQTLNSDLTDFNVELEKLDSNIQNTRNRYLEQFSAMESAVTSLKSTGDYLTNMIESWNSDN